MSHRLLGRRWLSVVLGAVALLVLSAEAGAELAPAPVPQEAGPVDPESGSRRVGSQRSVASGTTAVAAPHLALSLHRSDWWQGLADPDLTASVEMALAQNLDARAAWLRVSEAEAQRRQAWAPLLPTLDWNTSVNLAPTDSLGFQFGGAAPAQGAGGPAMPEVYWSGSSELQAGYQIDLSRKASLRLEAAGDNQQAQRYAWQQSAVALSSATAQAYLSVVGAKARAKQVELQIASAERFLQVVQSRFSQGLASATDVLQQRQQLSSILAQRPRAAAQLRAVSQQLAVLRGQAPHQRVATAETLPRPGGVLPQRIEPGLLSARPDLRAAALRVAAARKQQRAAEREHFPILSLSAKAGVQGIYMDALRDQFYWGAGATLAVPLYAGGRISAVAEQRQAELRSAENEMARVRLAAWQEAAGALENERERHRMLARAEAQLDAAADSHSTLHRRYLHGNADLLSLLTAFSALQQSELDLITARQDLAIARVVLQSSLASGAKLAPPSSSSNLHAGVSHE